MEIFSFFNPIFQKGRDVKFVCLQISQYAIGFGRILIWLKQLVVGWKFIQWIPFKVVIVTIILSRYAESKYKNPAAKSCRAFLKRICLMFCKYLFCLNFKLRKLHVSCHDMQFDQITDTVWISYLTFCRIADYQDITSFE